MRRVFLLVVQVAGAVVLLLSIRELVQRPIESAWFVLVALTLVTAWSTLRIEVGQSGPRTSVKSPRREACPTK